jgi:undecaprenyl-phosphate galactose phosphotransferase
MSAEVPSRRAPTEPEDWKGIDLPPGSSAKPEAIPPAPELHVLQSHPAAVPARRPATTRTYVDTRPVRSKRIFDFLGALALGLILSPFILVIALLIRLEGQPVVFRHKRVGRHGKVFHCLKFRTMAPNAEQLLRDLLKAHPELRDEWTQNHKLRDDPRITAVGRFLRRTSLDELPQLWNVIRGEMSLVGPRPIVRAELLRYGRHVASYLAVKPGLTGLWQVRGRSDTTYRRRVSMDKFYVSHQNAIMDLYILAATALVVLRRAGAY